MRHSRDGNKFGKMCQAMWVAVHSSDGHPLTLWHPNINCTETRKGKYWGSSSLQVTVSAFVSRLKIWMKKHVNSKEQPAFHLVIVSMFSLMRYK